MISQETETKFTILLAKYINESGFSINRISQITGLGRTAIQHTISGKLMPARPFIDKLISILPITPAQREEFIELYLCEKLGARIYATRNRIAQMLSNLNISSVSTEFSIHTLCPCEKNDSITTINGIANINRHLLSIVSAEFKKSNGSIFCSIPFENHIFFEMITQLTNVADGKISFDHFVRLFKDSDTVYDENIYVLENALRMSLYDRMEYHPYYHYAYKNSLEDFLPAFPYCLVSSDTAALISADLTGAVISSQSDFTNAVKAHIAKIRSHSTLMINHYNIDSGFKIFLDSQRLVRMTIEYQPCLTLFLSPELIENKLIDIPEKEEILAKIMNTFFTQEGLELTESQSVVNYFTREGMEDFAESGIMSNIPGELLKPLTPEERIAILQAMKQLPERFLLLDSRKLRLSDHIHIISLNNRSILINCKINNKRIYSIITESGLCAALDDFMSGICEMGWVLSEDDFCSSVDACIEHIRTMSSLPDNKEVTQ